METILTLIGVALLQSPAIIKGSENLCDEKNCIYLYRRLISVLLMLPVIINEHVKIKLQLDPVIWFMILFNANIILNVIHQFTLKSTGNRGQYLQVHLAGQSVMTHLANAISWMAYLVFYEILVRQILVNELLDRGVTIPIAMLISFAVYVVLHVPQGLKMTLAAIPFGILAAVWMYLTGSLLPVILLHIVCALGYDYIIGSNIKINDYENSANRLLGISGK